MKRILVILFFATSCSSMWSHRTSQKDVAPPPSGKAPPQMVSKEQYDDLAKKYQELLLASKNTTNPIEVIDVKKEQQIAPQVGARTNIDPSELVNHLDSALKDAAPSMGVVDALKEEPKKGPPMPTSLAVQQVNHTDDIDEQILQLREVATLIKVNKFENALIILKDLENSKEKQIVVRAKLMLGDLLFRESQFDLAMQAYEDIIKNHAYSGLVVKALGKLVACAEKLKQPEKQAKYYSLLHDFFEAA